MYGITEIFTWSLLISVYITVSSAPTGDAQEILIRGITVMMK
jgi:hypothetical protein